MAEGLNVSDVAVWFWESGKSQPRLEFVTRLLVFELRHLADGSLAFENTLLHELLTTQGVVRESAPRERKNGSTYTIPEKVQALDALIEGLQKVKSQMQEPSHA